MRDATLQALLLLSPACIFFCACAPSARSRRRVETTLTLRHAGIRLPWLRDTDDESPRVTCAGAMAIADIGI